MLYHNNDILMVFIERKNSTNEKNIKYYCDGISDSWLV